MLTLRTWLSPPGQARLWPSRGLSPVLPAGRSLLDPTRPCSGQCTLLGLPRLSASDPPPDQASSGASRVKGRLSHSKPRVSLAMHSLPKLRNVHSSCSC